MKIIYKNLTFILLLISRICDAQNLVPNGNFEQYTSCPTNLAQIDSALFWFNPCSPPYGPSGTGSGSSDYFNACASGSNAGVPVNVIGYQFAHSGNAYAGLILYNSIGGNFREYIEVSLSSPLISNTCYHMEIYVNLANGSQYTLDTLGVYFSDTAVTGIHSHDTLPFEPQLKLNSGFITDTLNWTLLTGNYIATGGENYLIIGNFHSAAQTNWLEVTPGGGNAFWYIDDITIAPCNGTGIEAQNENADKNIYPNPFGDKLSFKNSNNELSEIILYDISARKILQQKFTNAVSINTSQLAKGLYLYEVRDKNGLYKQGRVVKD